MPGPALQRVRVGDVVELPDGTEGDWFVVVPSAPSDDAPTRRSRRGKEPDTLSGLAHAPVDSLPDGKPIFGNSPGIEQHDPIA